MMNALALPVAFMLCVVVAEALALQLQRRDQEFSWRDVIFNLNSGHLMLWLFRGLEVALFAYVARHYSLQVITAWPLWLQWLFAILAWDFCFYWLHRIHHRYGLLWAIHLVHHQGEHFNLSLGVRNSWYSSLSSIPFFIILALLGVSTEMFVAVSTLHYSIQLFNHSALTPKLGWLEYLLVTPAHHRVHHGKHPAYLNKNFGGSFIFWDKLFGTFQQALPGVTFEYGVEGLSSSQNPFWANNRPLLRYWGRRREPEQPASRFSAPAWGIASGGILLFILVIGYVQGDGSWPFWQQAILFFCLLTGTVALGGIAEGRRWGLYSWLLLSWLLPLLYLGWWEWRDLHWLLLMPLLAFQSLCLLWSLYRPGRSAADS